jgi:hypothetical protein
MHYLADTNILLRLIKSNISDELLHQASAPSK